MTAGIGLASALALGASLGGAPDAPLQLDAVVRVAGRFAAPAGEEHPGFDVELLHRFAAWHRFEHGREVTFIYRRVNTVSEVLDAVRQGAHLGGGGITATTERDQLVDFSAECLPVRSVLVAPAGLLTPDGWRTQIKGRRLGAVVGSTNAAEVERLARAIEGVRPYPALASNEVMFAALTGAERTLDAAVTDLPQYWTLGRGRGLVVVEALGPPQSIALVLPEGSPLKAKIDEFLQRFTHSSEYYRMVHRYFGADAEQMVKASRGGAEAKNPP